MLCVSLAAVQWLHEVLLFCEIKTGSISFCQRCSYYLEHPSPTALVMDGGASLLNLRGVNGSSQSLEPFSEFVLWFVSFVGSRRYSEIPFSLLDDRVKVDGINLPLC